MGTSLREKYLPSPFLKADYLEARDMDSATWTIADYEERTFEGRDGKPDEDKMLLVFQECDKPLILNKTNMAFLLDNISEDADEWAGNRVKLRITMVNNPQGGAKIKSLALDKAARPKPAGTPTRSAKPAEEREEDPFENE